MTTHRNSIDQVTLFCFYVANVCILFFETFTFSVMTVGGVEPEILVVFRVRVRRAINVSYRTRNDHEH
jgi:hypothetical protein